MKFAEPEEAGGNRCYPKDVVNHLLLVWAIDYIAHSPTQYSRPDKPSDVIIVDCVDLDAVNEETGQPGNLARKCWWRQSRLIQSLKPRLGNTDPMLVRMSKGLGSKGMNAPFELVSQTGDPACVNRAQAWFTINGDFKPSIASVADAFQQSEQRAQSEEPPDWASGREETVLERMARQSQQQSPSLPPRQPEQRYQVPDEPAF
jgi:hypothetical protein